MKARKTKKADFRILLQGLDRSMFWEINKTLSNSEKGCKYFISLLPTGDWGAPFIIARGTARSCEKVNEIEAKYNRWAREIYAEMGLVWNAPESFQCYHIMGVISGSLISLEHDPFEAYRRNSKIEKIDQDGEWCPVHIDQIRATDGALGNIRNVYYHLDTADLAEGRKRIAEQMLIRMKAILDDMERYASTIKKTMPEIKAFAKGSDIIAIDYKLE